jgi:hypothetical protein
VAELLIKAVSATHADATKGERGCYKRGDPVLVMPDGHAWGSREAMPRFVILKVPGISAEAARPYVAPWTRTLSFVVDSSTPATDAHTMTVSVGAGVAAGGAGGVTREQVEAYLNRWRATVNSVAANAVTFTTVIFQAVASEGFWRRDVSAVGFTEVSYTQATGSHRVRADYPAAVSAAEAAFLVTSRGGVITSHNTGARRITFDITRALVRSHFEQDVRDRLEGVWSRRRFRLTDAEVTAAESAGGAVTRTAAQVQAALLDRQGA